MPSGKASLTEKQLDTGSPATIVTGEASEGYITPRPQHSGHSEPFQETATPPTQDPQDASSEEHPKIWTPWPLTSPVFVLTVFLMIGSGSVLATLFLVRLDGWEVVDFGGHLWSPRIYSIAPAAVAFLLDTLLSITYGQIRRIQPYINLANGPTSADDSVLLDYVQMNVLLIPFKALRRRHWAVLCSALMGLAACVLKLLASGLVEFRGVRLPSPERSVISLARIQQNNVGTIDLDFHRFLKAAVQATTTVNSSYVTTPINYDSVLGQEATIRAKVAALRVSVQCLSQDSVKIIASLDDSDAIGIKATFSECRFSSGPRRISSPWGVDVTNCPTERGKPLFARPVVFWTISLAEQLRDSVAYASICHPHFDSVNVTMELNATTGAVTSISPHPDPQSSMFPSVSEHHNDYNGLFTQTALSDDVPPLITSQMSAVHHVLTSTIDHNFTALKQEHPTNVQYVFNGAVQAAYAAYLLNLAPTLYFAAQSEAIEAAIETVQPRLFFTGWVVAVICTLLIMLLVGLGVLVWSLQDLERLRLYHEPGSIASVLHLADEVLFTTLQTTEESLEKALKGKNFEFDEPTSKITVTI